MDASMEHSSRNNRSSWRGAEGPVLTRWASQDTNQPSAASVTSTLPTDPSVSGPPGLHPENSQVFREALWMGMPRHLVLGAFRDRSRTRDGPYLSLRDLVTDLFSPQAGDREVPMVTDHLEEGLMLSCYTVRQALRLGAPLHLIEPLLRARILSTGSGYTHTYQLVADVNKLRK